MRDMYEISFTNQGNWAYMVIEVPPEHPLDDLAIGMITNNEIPGMIPATVRRRNSMQYVYYNISSLTPLAVGYGFLANDKRLLAFLQSLCRLSRECEDYLLTPGQLLLDEKYTYVKAATGEICVAYIPFVDPEQPTRTLYQFIKQLMARVTPQMPDTSVVLQQLFRVTLLEEQFSLANLEQVLTAMQTEGVGRADRHQAPPAKQPAAAVPPAAPQNAQVFQPKAPAVDVPPVYEPAPQPAPRNDMPPVPEEKGKQASFLGGLLGGSKKPREKEREPEKPAKPAKPAEKAEFGFAIPGMEPAPAPAPDTAMNDLFAPKAEPQPKPKKGGLFGGFGKSKKAEPIQPMKPDAGNFQPIAPAGPQAEAGPTSAPAVASAGGGYTVDLSGANSGMPVGTLPMNAAGVQENENQAQLWLVCRSNGQRMQITKSNFHIGRGQGLVDFVVAVATPYMGTDHAYILINNGSYYIVDNNTQNHTWLNGEMLESSRPYPIKSGDIIRMANETFDVVAQ